MNKKKILFFNSKTRPAYLKVGWNVLDFVVVLASLSNLAIGQNASSALKSIRSLRALRALRPLRMISRNESLKLVVNALFRAIPELGNVTLISGLALLIFAILGINFFKGRFYRCSVDDDSIKTK